MGGLPLHLRAESPPSAELLEQLKTHKAELLAELSSPETANRPKMPPHALLVRVANLLGVHRDYLLEQGFIEPCDLEEQGHADPLAIANLIRTNPRWIDRPAKHLQGPTTAQEGSGTPKAYQTHWTAALASAEWLQARDAFHHHIFSCSECYAPIGRYCDDGLYLKYNFDNTDD